MTDSRFEKLVNLYLDKEISPSELSDLKAEIAHNLVRKHKFERMCRVHAASRKALIGHSANSGVKKFLHEEIATVESRRGQRAKVRKAGKEDEAMANAQQLLWRTGIVFMCSLVVGALVLAYAIERTANIARRAPDAARQDEGLDFQTLQAQRFAIGKTDAFIVSALNERSSGDRISQFLILRLDRSRVESDVSIADIRLEHFHSQDLELSPIDLYQIEQALRGLSGLLPGTSAPPALPAPGSRVVLGYQDSGLTLVEP